MLHKRATRTVREREKVQRGTDSAPKISLEHEPIPKSVSRVLDAGQVRRGYRDRRVGNSDEGKKRYHDATKPKDGEESIALRIEPGETFAQFNRRVDNRMMPLVNAALRQSSAQARRVRREEVAQAALQRRKQRDKAHHPLLESPKTCLDPPPTAAADGEIVNPRHGRKEFEVALTSTPRRLNDIAQEPPLIKKLPRGATKNDAAPSGAVSMAQKAMMEGERDKAIRHYRELKARKLHEGGGATLDG